MVLGVGGNDTPVGTGWTIFGGNVTHYLFSRRPCQTFKGIFPLMDFSFLV